MKAGNVCIKHPELLGQRHNDGNCPECIKRSKREYNQRNRDKIRAYQENYRATNLVRLKELNAAWRVANPLKVRKNNLARTGFTPQLVEDAKIMQDGRCAICLVDLTTLPKRQVHADHCHTSGDPRGVLCHHCNAGLGAFRDNPDTLRRAIEYLAEPPLSLL